MRCLRSVHPDYGAEDKIFSGAGAAEHPGRWNQQDIPVICCSSTLSACASEQGYHSLLASIEAYNRQVSARGRRFPRDYYERILNVQFKVVEIEILAADQIVDGSTDSALSELLSSFGLPKKTIADCRRSGYELEKPEPWTRKFGALMSDKKVLGAVLPSARTNNGNTVVIFENNVNHAHYKLNRISDLFLSAVSIKGSGILQMGEPAKEDAIYFKSDLGEGIADVLVLME